MPTHAKHRAPSNSRGLPPALLVTASVMTATASTPAVMPVAPPEVAPGPSDTQPLIAVAPPVVHTVAASDLHHVTAGQIVALATTTAPRVDLAAATTPARTSASVGGAALAAAMTRIGAPYAWGATGPRAFDCSGLTTWAYKQTGVSLPRTAAAQSQIGAPVARDQLQPGDLVFFYNPVSHVGIYTGAGRVVNAVESGRPVQVSDMARLPFHNARRI